MFPTLLKSRSVTLLLWLVVLNIGTFVPAQPTTSPLQPNIIVIFTDDQGYNDIGAYGSPLIRTPRLDQMASEGLRFTDFYVAAPVCSASRASLLTGRYPDRHGTGGVYWPGDKGLDPQEVTLANVLGEAGYATACFGKWHLGDVPGSLPTSRGFSTYWGIPYSNDMFIGPTQPFAADAVFRDGKDLASAQTDQQFVTANLADRASLIKSGLKERVPLMRDHEIVEYPADQSTLTRRYFDHTIAFVDQARAQQKPFFIYLAPAMPHVPLFASDDFAGKSPRGLYGDTIEEIDAHVGRLLDHLDRAGLSENTLVVFTSDNGPWLSKGEDAGSAAPFRDGKFTAYEGGVRVPAIMRWLGHIPDGSESNEIAATIDLLPTLAHIAGATLPAAALDGVDLSEHIKAPHTPVTREAYYYFVSGKPVAIRSGNWKYLPHSAARNADKTSPPELYDLGVDSGEQFNLIATQFDRARALSRQLAQFATRPK